MLGRYTLAIHEAFDRGFAVDHVFVDDGWPLRMAPIPDLEAYAAVVWFVRFRELAAQPSIDWTGYRGHRVLFDEDAWHFFSSLDFHPPNRSWPETFRRHGFDLVLCTGERTREELVRAGVPAVWWPKAFDQDRFFDTGGERHGLCHFGQLYPARQAMLHRLDRAGIPVEHVRAPFDDLNRLLNRFAGLVVCTLANGTRTKFRRGLRRLNPEWGLRLSAGPEPMLKVFEGAGSGCAVFCDDMPDLGDLGFVDGRNIVTWKDFADLEDKLRWYLAHPEQLAAVGRAGHDLCTRHHTWDHRMAHLDRLLHERSPQRA
jgi:hypothetical protein